MKKGLEWKKGTITKTNSFRFYDVAVGQKVLKRNRIQLKEKEKHQSKESHNYMHKELAQNKHKEQETTRSYNERHESNCGD